MVRSLNDGFKRICVARKDIYLQRSLAVHGAKAAGRIGDACARQYPHYPGTYPLKELLDERKGFDLRDRPSADHEIRVVFQDRCDQFCDVVPTILVVAVCIYDDVGTTSEARVNADYERICQTAVQRHT